MGHLAGATGPRKEDSQRTPISPMPQEEILLPRTCFVLSGIPHRAREAGFHAVGRKMGLQLRKV